MFRILVLYNWIRVYSFLLNCYIQAELIKNLAEKRSPQFSFFHGGRDNVY
jgi:hypothetical protein